MKEIRTAALVLVVSSVLLGVVYPLLVTGIAQLAFPHRASGSLLEVDGRVVGSELIGQSFTSASYIHGRPSAGGYDALASGASNLGPTNPALLDAVGERVRGFRAENGLPPASLVPADAVLASGSGLDPDLGVEAALLQAERVASARGLDVATVRGLLERMARGPFLGAFGERRVNVLLVNLALDALSSRGG
jgi:K+-transporting ATPase ATPase C chain